MSPGVVLSWVLAASTPAPALVLDGEQAAYADMLNKQALDADALYGGSACAEAKVEHLPRTDVSIGDHPEIPAAREHLRVSGCGRSTLINVNVARTGGVPPWRMATGLPGASLAEMNLQQTAWPQVVTQVRATAPQGCSTGALGEVYATARVGGVAFTNLDGGAAPASAKLTVSLPDNYAPLKDRLNAGGAWAEVWPFTFCGADRTVIVLFIPLKDRTASVFEVIPVWMKMKPNGPAGRPAAAP